MSTEAGPNVVSSSILVDIDFSNVKGYSGLNLTDLSGNNFVVTTNNSGAGTCTIANGYAEFLPTAVSAADTYFSVVDGTRLNAVKSEFSLECVFYTYSNMGLDQYVRPFSARYTETSLPTDFNPRAGSIFMNIAADPKGNPGQDVNGYYSGYAVNSNVNINKWVHVTQTISASAGNLKTYVNGLLVNTMVFYGTPANFGSNGFLLGRGFFGGAKNYHGRISFMRMYSKVLTDGEVYSNFVANRGRFSL